MKRITAILIGTNNKGKYKEICELLPSKIKKYSPRDFKIRSPNETGKTFQENSFIKAEFFSRKTNLICLSDDSGLEINLLKNKPGIYSARWSGRKNNFNLAIKKIFGEINNINKNWYNKKISARFICNMTLYWPGGKHYSMTGTVRGKVSPKKKGKNGFGYDPIFVPNGYKKTFSEMSPRLKMSIDHRFKAYLKLKKFFS